MFDGKGSKVDTIVTVVVAAGTSAIITVGFLWTRYRFQLRSERAMLARWSRRDAEAFAQAAARASRVMRGR